DLRRQQLHEILALLLRPRRTRPARPPQPAAPPHPTRPPHQSRLQPDLPQHPFPHTHFQNHCQLHRPSRHRYATQQPRRPHHALDSPSLGHRRGVRPLPAGRHDGRREQVLRLRGRAAAER
ncbi:hypothetical protein LTR60_001913, partial [Cryomyces antarcticus]